MDFQIKDQFFIVTGASSGFGRAIAELLLQEGAHVLAVARTEALLKDFYALFPDKLTYIVGDITNAVVQQQVLLRCAKQAPSGVVVNAAGPPAKSFLETELCDWDEAYRNLLRWKVAFTQQLIPFFQSQQYGKMVFIESISVKQPVENLVLSNSLRLAVVGFVKSLAKDVANQNITLNILAPGFHNTAAMERLIKKKSDQMGCSLEETKLLFEQNIPVSKMGEASEIATLALWLLSPHSRFVTGQTFSHDGGMVHGVFG